MNIFQQIAQAGPPSGMQPIIGGNSVQPGLPPGAATPGIAPPAVTGAPAAPQQIPISNGNPVQQPAPGGNSLAPEENMGKWAKFSSWMQNTPGAQRAMASFGAALSQPGDLGKNFSQGVMGFHEGLRVGQEETRAQAQQEFENDQQRRRTTNEEKRTSIAEKGEARQQSLAESSIEKTKSDMNIMQENLALSKAEIAERKANGEWEKSMQTAQLSLNAARTRMEERGLEIREGVAAGRIDQQEIDNLLQQNKFDLDLIQTAHRVQLMDAQTAATDPSSEHSITIDLLGKLAEGTPTGAVTTEMVTNAQNMAKQIAAGNASAAAVQVPPEMLAAYKEASPQERIQAELRLLKSNPSTAAQIIAELRQQAGE